MSEINFPIDFVVPYVNNKTPQWRETYQKFCYDNGFPERAAMADSERYRDWGYFKYFMRGVEKYLPFVRKVFLLLQDVDQVPSWLNEDNVTIVYHRSFIPERFLPTYNSTTIEMFLDRIPGLSEHFIYANDDMYSLNPLTPEDFFTAEGQICMGFRRATIPKENVPMFDQVCYGCYNNLRIALKSLDVPREHIRPYHELTPMILSHLKLAREALNVDFDACVTPFRTPYNYNQYIYPLYELITKNAVQSRRTYIYANMENSVDMVVNAIIKTPASVFVLNDNHETNLDSWNDGAKVTQAFETKFPSKCKYEKRVKVSICICVYNAEGYIEGCLKSIPRRDDIEVIILDDKSTDNTLAVIKQEIVAFKNHTLLINDKNMGVGAARNTLLDNANGEYIFFLDSDDYIYTEVFEDILTNDLKDQNILMPKYVRTDGFNEYPTILRGVFINKDYIGNIRFNPALRCYEDVEYKKRLEQIKTTLDIQELDKIVYFYNKPRIGSLTWEYRKALGDPSYQKDEKLWEKYRKGRRG